MHLVDTHCHLYMSDHFSDAAAVVGEAAAAGVSRLIIIGIDQATCDQAVALASRFSGVYAVVGLHPNNAASYQDADLLWIEALAQDPKVLAIGEIGLDFHWDHATPAQQERALAGQLELARSLSMPVVFHCRKAYPELLTYLESQPVCPYLLHCFGGAADDARRATDLNAYIGVDGPVTYKSASDLRDVLSQYPGDRIVLETDSPYLPPEPYRGKTNSPAYLPIINRALACVRGWTEAESAQRTTDNAERFFALPPHQSH